ncbi:hypothetical protein BgiMline_030242, partial [Biomphalaria glabrata]
TMNNLRVVSTCFLMVSAFQQALPGLNCADGYFMDFQTNSCQPCTTIPEDYNAMAVYNCSSTHDAKYRCKEGFFNSDGAETLVCQKCRECDDPGSFVVKNCSAEQDTECSSQKIGADEPTTTTARNRINTTTSQNMTSTQQDKRATDNPVSTSKPKTVTDNPTSTSTNSQTRMTFSNKTSGLQNMISTSDSTRGTDNKTNVTGFTCGRNTRLDPETKSCIQCGPCTYVDHDLHSQQTCDLCSGGNDYSYFVYCPKTCLSEEF